MLVVDARAGGGGGGGGVVWQVPHVSKGLHYVNLSGSIHPTRSLHTAAEFTLDNSPFSGSSC